MGKEFPHFIELVKRALENDQNASPAALGSYLIAIREIAEELHTKFDDDEIFASDSEKLLRMLCQCTERLSNLYSEKKRVLSSSIANSRPVDGPTVMHERPQKSSMTCDPINRAVQENTKLYYYHRAKIDSGRLSAADIATMNMNLQRRMMENLEVAKQQKNLMERLREKRKTELSQELSGSEDKMSEEFKTALVEVTAFEEEVPELQLFSNTLKEQSSIDLCASYVRAVFEYSDHPLTVAVRDARMKMMVKLNNLLEKLEQVTTPICQRTQPDGADDIDDSPIYNRSNTQLLAELSDLITAAAVSQKASAEVTPTVKSNDENGEPSSTNDSELIEFNSRVVSYTKALSDAVNGENRGDHTTNQPEDNCANGETSAEGAVDQFQFFPKQPSQIDRDVQLVVAEIRQEMSRDCDLLMRCSSLRNVRGKLSEFEQTFIEDFCDTTLTQYHFAFLREPLLKVFGLKTEREQRAIALCESAFAKDGLSFLGLDHMDLSDISDRSINRFLEIMNESSTPDVFLTKYVKFCKDLCSTATLAQLRRTTEEEDSNINADDLVSYLCITILRAEKATSIVPVLTIVENFVSEKKLLSEEGYCLTATVTAVRYLMSLIEQKTSVLSNEQ